MGPRAGGRSTKSRRSRKGLIDGVYVRPYLDPVGYLNQVVVSSKIGDEILTVCFSNPVRFQSTHSAISSSLPPPSIRAHFPATTFHRNSPHKYMV